MSLTTTSARTAALALAIAMAAPAAPLPAQSATAPASSAVAASATSAAPATTASATTTLHAAGASTATLRPGDIIRLRIWREPDLSGEFAVDELGVATFPKIGAVKVSAETAETLKGKLLSGYQEYLKNPSIDITLLRRVNILGAVQKPGVYQMDPTMSMADALAMAGGATPDGDRHKAIVTTRDGSKTTIKLGNGLRITDTPIQSGDQIYVPERSWFSRNQSIVAASLSATASVIIALFLK